MTSAAQRVRVAAPPAKPLVLFDGECRFCRMWADRWTESSGDRIDLASSQSQRGRFPEIPDQAFADALQLIDTDGTVYAGAEAVLRSRSLGLGRRGLALRTYTSVPGVAPVLELAYTAVARNRPVFSFLTRWLWGNNVVQPHFSVATEVFLRLLAVIYGIAFLSFWVQLNGLVGPHGILPASEFLDAVTKQVGGMRWLYLPSLCWIFGSGIFLHVLCAAGVVLAVAAFCNVLRALCLIGLWVAWLSLAAPGQLFLSFQWDTLLLEAGFLSIFLASWRRGDRRPDPPRAARWLLWWLLIRLMVLSGAVKLTSGDGTWRDLTALNYHYQTQPLPTWVGWWVAQLPPGFHRFSCLVMFVIELGAPLLLLGPRRLRLTGALSLIALQVVIALTGNYTYFNLLSIALCLLFLDDAWWARWFAVAPAPRHLARAPGFLPRRVLDAVFILVFILTTSQALPEFSRKLAPPAWMSACLEAVSNFRSLNNYGLFRVMTTQRPEIVFEGSDDGETWLAYEFNAKPGDPARRPGFVAPHQPRLDWQLWFAALDYPRRDPWVLAFIERLLQGEPAVLGLLRTNPFPKQPPRFLRAVLYEYEFTRPAEHARSGNWWRRTPIDYYVRPTRLR
jgi:predicted DCC family thiol-disulfide oxidoreductase YuxK